ncbi:MAG: hypothetical protein IPK80_07835 [Nannocystis sp.]|nr:hypothetical protein [Nannocystis sp.]
MIVESLVCSALRRSAPRSSSSPQPASPAACAPKLDERIARAWCDHAVECGTYKNISTCMEATYSEPAESYLTVAIDAGRIDYDGAQASRCVRAIRALKCRRGEETDAVDAACAGIFSGAVPPDEPCMIAGECVGQNSVCGRPPGCSGECCPGECRYRPGPLALGEACARDSECERDAFCWLAGDEPRCAAIPEAGYSCAGHGRCDRDSFCDANTCQRRGSNGDPCQGSDQCEPDTYCGAGGRCTERARDGDPCDPDYGDEGCLDGDTYCVDLRCQKRALPGELCSMGAGDCVAYAFCYDAVCVEYASLGEPCDGVAAKCHPSLNCEDERCARYQDEPELVCPIPE